MSEEDIKRMQKKYSAIDSTHPNTRHIEPRFHLLEDVLLIEEQQATITDLRAYIKFLEDEWIHIDGLEEARQEYAALKQEGTGEG